MIRALIFLVLALALAGAAFWVYRRSEVRVAGWRLLATLRASALVVLLAVLFDVRVPWGGAGGGSRRWALLDVSASMSAGDSTPWEGALARARELETAGWTVAGFGEGVEGASTGGLEPRALRTELAPALRRAEEAGASEVIVLSDLRFEDPVAAASAVAAGPVPVRFEAFGGAVRNAGIGAFEVSDQARRGEPVEATLEIFGEGLADSLPIEIREEDALILSTWVAAPAPGRRGRAAFELPAPRGEGRLRYAARVVLPGDAFPSDDRAVAYMSAGRAEGGLLMVSLRPDWEPRALMQVLADATGLHATGYLRAGPDRFVPMGRAVEQTRTVDSATVRTAAAGAALLVVHGLDARTDAWGRSLAAASPSVLLWPVDATGAATARVAARPPEPGEWYAAEEARASPIAGELAGARWQDLPPLSGLMPLEDAPPSSVPLEARLAGAGPARPAIVLDASGGRRRAVALASGFWRWEARGGAARETYRRVWSGVGGWLLRQDASTAVAELRPERWVVPARRRVGWRIPSEAPDALELELTDATGAVVTDTTLPGGPDAFTPPLPPGTYRYRARAGGRVLGEGRFDVEARSEEMLPRPAAPGAWTPPPRAAQAPGRSGHPLRTTPWPYLLVLLLLSMEWIGRRRMGLR